MAIKTNTELIDALQNVADNYKTTYMWGVFGNQVAESIIADKTKQYPNWYTAARQASLRALIGKGYWGFDCVCLIKGVLWGWCGDTTKSRGGAAYLTNDVPDVSADGMIAKCSNVSTDFSKIEAGEAVHLTGHIGIYIGDGKVIECTPSWTNGVQITACKNIGTISGLSARMWERHGKLPYTTYEGNTTSQAATRPIIRYGSTGTYIRELQTLLNSKGHSCGTVDGIFGVKTLAAVKAFQKAKGLTADGICGPITWAALLA